MLLLALACAGPVPPCAEGFERASDGNCYPAIRTSTDGNPDDTLPTVPTGGTGPTEDEFYDGPVYVEYGAARCNADDTAVILDARTRGWAWRAVVDVFGTGTAAPSDEEHDLFSVGSDPDGYWDELEVGPLVAGSDPEFAVPNLHTTFRCEDVVDRLLTYAVRVYDLDGALLDCGVWGHDEALVRSGAVTTEQVTEPADFSSCFLLEGPT